MNSKTFNDVRATILSDPELRREYYEHGRQLRAEALKRNAAEAEQEEQRFVETLYRRTQYTPAHLRKLTTCATSAAEAWMAEHPEEFSIETAPTVGALHQLVLRERARFQAARERLREIGIR